MGGGGGVDNGGGGPRDDRGCRVWGEGRSRRRRKKKCRIGPGSREGEHRSRGAWGG